MSAADPSHARWGSEADIDRIDKKVRFGPVNAQEASAPPRGVVRLDEPEIASSRDIGHWIRALG